MPEMKTRVKMYSVEYVCDECRKGVMQSTGITLTSNPPQYPHRCNKCGAEQTFMECYPYTTRE